jgi:hypothetical protein
VVRSSERVRARRERLERESKQETEPGANLHRAAGEARISFFLLFPIFFFFSFQHHILFLKNI